MRRTWFEGTRVVALASLAIAAASLACIVVDGAGSAAGSLGIRVTARISALLFLAAFVASSLVALWPRPWSKWLLRNRRYIGLSMAVSHAAHLAFIVALAVHMGDAFWAAQGAVGLIGGSVGYVFLIAMVATSTDRAVARLGRARWRLLHLTGMYVLWGIFVFSYAGLATRGAGFALLTAALVAGLGLRIARRVRDSIRIRNRAAA